MCAELALRAQFVGRRYAAEDTTSSRSTHAICDSYGVERIAPIFALRAPHGIA
jgi:hypothetical protein